MFHIISNHFQHSLDTKLKKYNFKELMVAALNLAFFSQSDDEVKSF